MSTSLRKTHSGLSLVEILVALAIAAVIMAGVVQLFVGSKQTDNLSNGLARLQENARFAMDILTRNLRLTGYMGCADPNFFTVTRGGSNNQDFANNSPIQANFQEEALQGFEIANDGATVTLANGASFTDTLGNTDAITSLNASSVRVATTANMANASAEIPIGDNSFGFTVDDVVMISSCTGANVAQVTAINGSAPNMTLAHEASGNSSASLEIPFPENSTVHRIVGNTYYIRTNPLGNRSLYRRSAAGLEELVEGIQNMQILYGVYDNQGTPPTNDDQVRYVDASQLSTDPANANYVRNVVSVQIALLVETLDPVLTENGPTTYTLLGTNVTTPSDRRLRRVFTTTIPLRNRRGGVI